MKSILATLLLIVLAGLVGFGGVLLVMNIIQPTTPPPTTAAMPAGSNPDGDTEPNPFAEFRLADFTLTDQDGDPFNSDRFEGNVTALNFFFTSCPGPCPAMMQVMRRVQDETAGTGLRLASITVDGTRDTPEVLSNYAQGIPINPDRWTLLTGDPELVGRLTSESLGYDLRTQDDIQIEGPGGVMMANILHPTRILLVGPDRRLIGVYAYNDPDQVEQLIAEARSALED